MMNRSTFFRMLGGMGLGYLSISNSLNKLTEAISEDLYPVLIDQDGKPIKSLSKWLEKKKIIKKRWLNYLGALESNPNIPQLNILKEDNPENLTRQLVEYEGESNIKVQGYLIKPKSITTPLPGIVAMHSTSDNQMLYISGVKEGDIVPFGYRLAKQGFVVFCPQCFLWHNRKNFDYVEVTKRFQKRHPDSKGMAKMLFDAQRAVDVLVSLDEVDSTRIGAMGHSLGAKQVFYLGAFDDRVKAIVSNEGGIGIEFSNWDSIWYLGKEIYDFNHKHHELLALIAPKAFLLIGGNSADGEQSKPYLDAVYPVYDLYNRRDDLKLLNHGQGHSVTALAEKKTYKWLTDRI